MEIKDVGRDMSNLIWRKVHETLIAELNQEYKENIQDMFWVQGSNCLLFRGKRFNSCDLEYYSRCGKSPDPWARYKPIRYWFTSGMNNIKGYKDLPWYLR